VEMGRIGIEDPIIEQKGGLRGAHGVRVVEGGGLLRVDSE
jgi:hypothetical protein